MANWDKLNTEFDRVLSSMTDADWNKWQSERAFKKTQRRNLLQQQAKEQQKKL